MHLTSVIFTFFLHHVICHLPTREDDQKQVSLGQSKYTELTDATRMPRYGPCWLGAMTRLPSTCDDLTEDSHARLALQFTNCLLAQTGQRTYPCAEQAEISSCLGSVETNAWTSYTNFYTHTHNMCHFLKSQQWRELTHQTINKLSDTSAQTVKRLEVSHELQQDIAAGQKISLEYQRQLVENGSVLSQAIESSRGNVKEMMEEFKLSTLEQRNMIFEVFDRVSRLQSLVVSEVSWLYTVIFYSFCLLVIYLVTATRRTADARLWLFLILTVNFGLERLVIKVSLMDQEHAAKNILEAVDISEVVNQRVWIVRNSTVLVSLITLVIMAIRFKDYNLINNKLLEDIQQQNLELKRSMETFKLDNKNSYNVGKPGSPRDSLDGLAHLKLREMLDEDAGWQADREEDEFSDDEDSDDSYNSTFSRASERTLSFEAGSGSRETTPTPQNDINLAMEDIGSRLVMSTPLKSVNEIPQLLKFEDDLPMASTSGRGSRPSSTSRRVSSSAGLNVSSNYNLRPRSRASNSSVLSCSNSVLESPVKSQDVSKLKSIANRNKTKIEMQIGRQARHAPEETPPVKDRRKSVRAKSVVRAEYSADED